MPSNLLENSVRHKLRRLQAGIKVRLASEGLAWMLLAAAGALLATLAVDYLLDLPRVLRAAAMAGAVALLVAVVIRYIIRPLRVPLDSENLALLVERRYKQLKDRLISAIQFGRHETIDNSLMSAEMVDRMTCEANDLVGRFNFQEIIEKRSMWRMIGLAMAAIMLISGFAAWQPRIMGLYVQRNFLLRDVAWPQKTWLVVSGASFKVLRGDDLVVDIEADLSEGKIAPQTITIFAKYPSLSEVTQEKVSQTTAGSGVYQKVFAAVNEPFQFHVVGGDDKHDALAPHVVHVIDPPALTDVDFQVQYHDYVNKTPDSFSGGGGGLAVRVGSTIVVTGTANKNISSAVINFNGTDVARMELLEAPAKDGLPAGTRSVRGRFNIGIENKPSVGTLKVNLVDTEGYTNRRAQQYLVQLSPDLPPVVDLKTRGVGPRITAVAVVPLLITVKDDVGIAAVSPRAMGIGSKDATTGPASAPATFGKPDVDGPTPALSAGTKQYAGRADVDIKSMNIKPGQTLAVAIDSRDNLPPQFGGPNQSTSNTINFSIVKPEELMEEIVARQRTVRIEFMQSLKLQEDARGQTIAAVGAAAESVSAEAKQHAAESGRLEVAVAANCSKAASALEAILEEMVCNRLGKPEDVQSLRQDVVEALKSVQQRIGLQVAALGTVAGVDDQTEFREQAMEIAKQQEEILKLMDAIVQRMQKIESRTDIANQVEVLIHWSRELLDGIQKHKDQGIEDEFAPKAKDAPGNP